MFLLFSRDPFIVDIVRIIPASRRRRLFALSAVPDPIVRWHPAPATSRPPVGAKKKRGSRFFASPQQTTRQGLGRSLGPPGLFLLERPVIKTRGDSEFSLPRNRQLTRFSDVPSAPPSLFLLERPVKSTVYHRIAFCQIWQRIFLQRIFSREEPGGIEGRGGRGVGLGQRGRRREESSEYTHPGTGKRGRNSPLG